MDDHDFDPDLVQKWVGVTIWFWRCNKRKGYTLIWSWLRLDIWWFCSIESTMKSADRIWLSREHFRPIKFNLERRTVPNRIKPRVSSNVKNILFYQKHVTYPFRPSSQIDIVLAVRPDGSPSGWADRMGRGRIWL